MRKKITMLIASLLCCVGVVRAAVTDLPEMSTEVDIKWYTIKNVRQQKYATYAGDAETMTQQAYASAASFFYFTASSTEGAVKIHNYAAGERLCAAYNSWTATGIDWYLAAQTTGVSICTSKDEWNAWNDASGDGQKIEYWSASDKGSAWEISLVTDFSTIIDIAALKDAAIAELTNMALIPVFKAAATEAIAAVKAVEAKGTGLAELNAAVEEINEIVTDCKKNSLAEKYFTLFTAGRNQYAKMTATGTAAAATATSPDFIWQFVENNGAYNIYNPYIGKYLGALGSVGGPNIAVTANQAEAGVYNIGVVTEDVTDGEGNATGEKKASLVFNVGGAYIHLNGSLLPWYAGGPSYWTIAEVTDFTEWTTNYKNAAKTALDMIAFLSVDDEKATIDAIEANIEAFEAIDAIVNDVAQYVAFRNSHTDSRANNYLGVDMVNSKGNGTGTFNHLSAVWSLKYTGRGSFYIYNVNNKVYLGNPDSNGTLTETPSAEYTFNVIENNKVKLKSGEQTLHLNNHNGNGTVSSGWFLSSYDNNDPASCWYVETDFADYVSTYKTSAITDLDGLADICALIGVDEILAKAKTAVEAIETIATIAAIDAEYKNVTDAIAAKMFTIQTIATDNHREGVWVSANMTTEKAIGLHGEHNYNSIWSLRHAGDAAFYLYNELNSVYLGAPSGNCPLTESPTAAYTFEIIDAKNSVVEMHVGEETLHASNHDDDKLLDWDGDENASRWTISTIDVAADIQTLLNGLTEDDYAEVPALGQYPTAAYNALVAARTSAKTVEEVEVAIATFKAAKNLPVFTIDGVIDYAAGKSIYDNSGTLYFKATSVVDKTMWWALDMTETTVGVTDEVGIYNVGTGNGFWGASSIEITETSENDAEDGIFLFYTTGNNTPIHYQNTNQVIVRFGDKSATSGSAHKFTYIGNTYDLNKEFTITEGENYTYAIQHPVKELNYNRTFSNCNWQSLYVPFDIPVSELTESFDVARIESVEGDEELSNVVMNIEKITEGELTANTAYFIRAKEQGSLNLKLTTIIYPAVVNSTEYTINNFNFVITGTYEKMSLGEGQYALSGGQWKAPANADVKLNPFRVYCTVTNNGAALTPEAAAAMAIRISTRGESDEETTNIESISKNQDADVIYDLLGRRVLNTSKGGIYIINNKKVVIK